MANNEPDKTIFEESRSRFLIGLTNSEKNDFKFTTLQGVHDAIDKIQDEHGSQRKMRNMTRIRGFIEAMEQYGTVIEVFLNVSDFIAFIWGPVKFLLLVAKTWAESLDTLLDAYEQLGEAIPLLCQYESLFTNNKHMRRLLGCIYADILEFHRRALVIFKRKAWKQLFHSTWKDFNAHFRRLLDSLRNNAALIGQQATLVEIKENQRARKEQEKHILDTERGELQRQALSVISKLSPADYELDYDNASVNWMKGQSFGLWLLENTKVKAWLDPTDANANLLWLKGIPGAGKTILTSRLIAVMREMDRHDVVFFYCKDEDKLRNSLAAILKGLISQLLTINPGVLSYLYDECAKSREVTIESLTALKLLITIAVDCGEPLWLIVDGLDECEQKETRKILTWMLPLLKSGDGPSNLRLLIVSRDEGDIGARLSKAPGITLHNLEAHSNEIRVYTSRKLMKIQKKFQLSKEEAKELGDRINSGAKGMFLFARLMLKHLKCQTSLTELRAEVNPSQFPDGLDQVYERIEDTTFPAPNTLVSPEPTESTAQDSTDDDFEDTSRPNTVKDISNKLGELDLSTVPTQFKTIGDDWFAISNPTIEQSVAVELLHTFSEDGAICSANFCHDATMVALSSNEVVNIFDVTSGTHLCCLSLEPPATGENTKNYIRSVAFGPDATGLIALIAAGSEDRLLRVWNFNSKMLIHTLAGHDNVIYSIGFANSGLIIASASSDETQ
ncbi:hypothetical protein VE03_00429 [Pseudogymnoascus sp. 23342-1-I1]|nr:hypothetical protein VE03_00429 [Pseudogymnoascus sp. 23342-1-I1]